MFQHRGDKVWMWGGHVHVGGAMYSWLTTGLTPVGGCEELKQATTGGWVGGAMGRIRQPGRVGLSQEINVPAHKTTGDANAWRHRSEPRFAL